MNKIWGDGMKDIRDTLMARMAVLAVRIGAIDSELDSHTAKDWDDMAVERESDEVLEGLGLSGQQEMAMIHAALARLDAGTFGICAKCGQAITPARLDAVPYTPFCRTCAV
jgi:RNA polymerase-binding transcription factor DksA